MVVHQKRAVLLIHALASRPEDFAPLEPALHRLRMPASRPLLPGHGTDFADLAHVTWQEWYRSVEQVYRTLRQEYDQVAVVGRSLGGLLAALLASREQDVAAVGLVAPALRWASKATTLLTVPGLSTLLVQGLRFLPRDSDGINDPSLKTANETLVYPRISLHAIREVIALGRVVENELAKIKAPTLIIHSRRDRVILPQSAEIAFQSIGATDKRLVWFEHSGHEMFLDSERDAVAAALGGFLAEAMPGDAKYLTPFL